MGRGREGLRSIAVLYRTELRSALRERTIVVNSILVPLLLYPLILWLTMTGISFVTGRAEEQPSRVALLDPQAAPDGLTKALRESKPELELEALAPDSAEPARDRVSTGDLDVVLAVVPPAHPDLAQETSFHLTWDGSRDRSASAHRRIVAVLDEFRRDWTRERARREGITDPEWQQFEISLHNIASEREMGTYVLGLVLPLLLVIMIALGCFHPAIDATAGERERGTWETLMTIAVPRSQILAAKYLYVATLGTIAGLLNLIAMTISIRGLLAPMLRRSGESLDLTFPLTAVPILALGAVLLALFVAAGMMLLASFARTFKEGQSLVTPFYLLLILPVLFLQDPDIRLTPLLAWLPVGNVMLVFREAISGQIQPGLVAIALAVQAATVFLCLWAASTIVRFEEVLLGSHDGSLARFLKERLFPRRAAAPGEPR